MIKTELIISLGLAVFLAAILGVSLLLGKTWIRGVGVVSRVDKPLIYWTTVLINVVGLLVVVFIISA